jgi:Spx/MgsR family transcriptional regulator
VSAGDRLGMKRSDMTITMYGIKNCDTVRAARSWLKDREVDYRFVDFRADRLQPATVQDWFDRAGWRTVLNTASTGYRALPDAEKAAVDEARARSMILADPTIVKRPVLDLGEQLLFGFKPAAYETALAAPR